MVLRLQRKQQIRSRNWPRGRAERKTGMPGFMVFIPVLFSSLLQENLGCKPFSRVNRDQNAPPRPLFPSEFAGNITLGRTAYAPRYFHLLAQEQTVVWRLGLADHCVRPRRPEVCGSAPGSTWKVSWRCTLGVDAFLAYRVCQTKMVNRRHCSYRTRCLVYCRVQSALSGCVACGSSANHVGASCAGLDLSRPGPSSLRCRYSCSCGS